MNCVEVKIILQLYLDNELSTRETLDVQTHLDECSACAQLLADFNRQDELLRQAARAEITEQSQLRAGILAALRQPAAPPRQRSWWLYSRRWAAAAAALLMVIAALLWNSLIPGINEKVYAAAVADHADHCTLDKLSLAVTGANELDRLCALYGKLAKTPDLSAFGFANPHAKECALNGAPTLHLIFYDAAQQPLSVFLRVHQTDFAAPELRTTTRAAYHIASASQAGIDLLVVSEIDDAQLRKITQAILQP